MDTEVDTVPAGTRIGAHDELAAVERPALGDEYESEPVPLSARRGLWSVSAVWLGFPMILTCAVFGGLIVYSLGFWRGMLAILLGNLVLMGYVGALSYLAGATGKSFALIAVDTFGRRGYRVVSAFLATVVIGWFAFQTGLTGSILAATMGWSERWTSLGAGIGYVLVTLLGIRALSAIGVIAAPLYLALGVTAVALALDDASWSAALDYSGGAGTAALSMGAAVTLVVACFIDSGTMTADFTRWSKNGRQGFLAAFSAFPLGNSVALVIGGLIVALGAAADPARDGGNFLAILIDQGGWLVPVAVVFVFVNLGSVCAHCLYNGAVGWGQLTGRGMRSLSVVLGAVGVALAVAGVWSHFETWLNLLGVIVPPIGIVLILDQLVLPRLGRARPVARPWRRESFLAWGIGSAAALAAHEWAPGLSDALVGMVVGAVVFYAARVVAGDRETALERKAVA
ncbi:cytosine permease [Nocardia takedensis]|uniref:cytosine permease n=1 Tax=Nocardia takedensis TaxID=259390 RepID=UPI00030A75AC|nr:cytosine permease [Nocardia takedensis]